MSLKPLIKNPIGKNNPITVQVLGICSALAVTAQMKPALVMAISVTVVVAFSNLVISLLRNTIPPRIRIIVQLVIVAMMVILVDQFLKAFFYETSKQLSVFVGLIITNCIVMGRLEAFAMSHKPLESFVDGIGNGIGYSVIPASWYAENGGFYQNNGLFILPPMALVIVGVIIWIQRSRNKELCEKN